MYELIQVSEHDYYIDCPAKIGLVRIGENEVALIDSGNDKDAGKKVLKILNANGWQLKALYNTHSHADHIGGNHFLQEKTGCRVFAPGMECVYTVKPELESMGLYGGFPFRELQNKFLMAQPSDAAPLTAAVLPEGWEIIRLPGHSFDMVGFKTAEGTVYAADSVSSEETLNKYGIGYMWHPGKALESLEMLKTVNGNVFVPSHAAVTDSMDALADINIAAIEQVKECIAGLCKTPISFEELLKALFDRYTLTMSAQQYVLIGSTVRSYLSWLYETGKVTFEFKDNRMLWQKKADEGEKTDGAI